MLDDNHEEGNETLTLTLSNPSPSRVRLADSFATGTIRSEPPFLVNVSCKRLLNKRPPRRVII